MNGIYREIENFAGRGYSFFSILGFFIASFNFYIYFLLINNYEFSISFYIFISMLFFLLNFVFSAITSLYVDLNIEDVKITAKEVFYIYGITEYLTFLLIPLAYFRISNIASISSIIGSYIVVIGIWLLRISVIRKKTGLGFLNSVVAVFFPQIILFSTLIILSFLLITLIKVYA